MTAVVKKVNFIYQVFYIGDYVCFVGFVIVLSQQIYLLRG